MTKEKAMYQTWLIVQGLSKAERELIPPELMAEIEDNMEVDESITINFDIPLEKQKLDSKTWNMLDRIVKATQKASRKKEEIKPRVSKIEKSADFENVNEELQRLKLENIRIAEEMNRFKDDSKDLATQYRDALEKYMLENEKIKNDYNELVEKLNKIPKFIRKIFIKEDNTKLLTEGKK